MLGHGVPSGGAAVEGRASRTTTPGVLCAPRRLLGDAGMCAGGPGGPELPLPWCPARRRRRHGAARGGAAPQHAGPARPRGARLQGNDVSVTSWERRHCQRSCGSAGRARVPGLRRARGRRGSVPRGARGAPRPSAAGSPPRSRRGSVRSAGSGRPARERGAR